MRTSSQQHRHRVMQLVMWSERRSSAAAAGPPGTGTPVSCLLRLNPEESYKHAVGLLSCVVQGTVQVFLNE